VTRENGKKIAEGQDRGARHSAVPELNRILPWAGTPLRSVVIT
jgi:hypothetical protein